MPVGYLHFFLRKIASLALSGFFKEIHVIGDENVPLDGPLIVCCTHHNMMIDPAILCKSRKRAICDMILCILAFANIQRVSWLPANTMPELRPVHYWAKASLFAHPIGRKILLTSGVIPVDRGSKDNQVSEDGYYHSKNGPCSLGIPRNFSPARLMLFLKTRQWRSSQKEPVTRFHVSSK